MKYNINVKVVSIEDAKKTIDEFQKKRTEPGFCGDICVNIEVSNPVTRHTFQKQVEQEL